MTWSAPPEVSRLCNFPDTGKGARGLNPGGHAEPRVYFVANEKVSVDDSGGVLSKRNPGASVLRDLAGKPAWYALDRHESVLDQDRPLFTRDIAGRMRAILRQMVTAEHLASLVILVGCHVRIQPIAWWRGKSAPWRMLSALSQT